MSFARLTRVAIAALALSALAGSIVAQEPLIPRQKVGEFEYAELSSPHPYAAGEVFELEIEQPGATYMKVHFARFDLAPGDFLEVLSADGRERYVFQGRGYKDWGENFWVNSVLGDKVILRLHSLGSTGGYGFDIDYYARGIVPIVDDPPGGGDQPESVCGTNDWQDVECYSGSFPTEFDRARRAVVVLYNGNENCTGVKVGCPNQFLTNEHCVTSQADVNLTEVRFEYQNASCGGGGSSFSQSYLGDLFLTDDYTQDFCLFTTNGSSDDYQAAELDDRLPPVGERIYLSGHPVGGPKKLSLESTHSSNPSGFCEVDASPYNGRGANSDVGYYCDTTGGSSGSPVWSGVTHKVVALHHFGGCLNSGGRMDLILPQIQSLLTPCITECGDGVQEGDEECDGADLGGATCNDINCLSGTPTCFPDCTLDYAGCGDCVICDGDGVCDSGEDCIGCPDDCFRGAGGSQGNGVCETANGENCLNTPDDCNGRQNGNPRNRYCCGDGIAGQGAVTCGDPRCTGSGNLCTSVLQANSCCGDTTCEGAEDPFNCEVDCGAPPCGDMFCDGSIGETECTCADDCGAPPASETDLCTDGIDNDCGGGTDCDDTDCSDDPACECLPRNADCSADSQCCSGDCKGNGRCR